VNALWVIWFVVSFAGVRFEIGLVAHSLPEMPQTPFSIFALLLLFIDMSSAKTILFSYLAEYFAKYCFLIQSSYMKTTFYD